MTPPTPAQLEAWRRELAGATPETILRWAAAAFPGRVAFASSLGAEDQALTALVAEHVRNQVQIFTLDTGRLFPEAYDLIARTEFKYRLRIRLAFPDAAEVEELVRQHGVNLFRESVELRKKCCEVRKLRPLRRMLAGLDAWICGLRKGQGATRGDVAAVEWDAANGLVKVNPLAGWSEGQLWAYIREHKVPYNPLHDQGFPSIGCACCTRAVQPGEEIRAGRWWWEQPEHKECGLHQRRR
ncbi:MAG: phosphoadenylyl-sulfate reductase [Lentisphaeria bacterium]|jgi:phosphoadenosine phosphosulfate reductase